MVHSAVSVASKLQFYKTRYVRINVTFIRVRVTSFAAEKMYTSVCPRYEGPCHHGMARPQVADGGTASDMEVNCE